MIFFNAVLIAGIFLTSFCKFVKVNKAEMLSNFVDY